MPAPYWVSVHVGGEAETEQLEWIPLLLPHEWVHWAVGHWGSAAELQPARDSALWGLLVEACQGLNMNPLETVPLSIWGDGVKWTKKSSLMEFLQSYPGRPGAERSLLFAVPTQKCSQRTYKELMDVLLWSYRVMYTSFFPTKRHDGQAWLTSDRHRATLAKQPCTKGLLLYIKGDWDSLTKELGLPRWNADRICWKCDATQQTWRQPALCQQLSSSELLAFYGANLSKVSPHQYTRGHP